MLGIAESTYYSRKNHSKTIRDELPSEVRRGRPCTEYSLTTDGRKISNEQIKEWLLELVEGEEQEYGYKLLAECIREKHHLVFGNKKAYRLCRDLHILQVQRSVKPKHPRRLPKNQLITGSNQLWQMDIKYGYVERERRFFFILSMIDVFDRVIVGYYQGTVCRATHACKLVKQALTDRVKEGDPLPVIRTDNGPQFVSAAFGDMCEELQLIHERIPPKTPNMNAYIESFHSLIERNLLSKNEFETLEQAYAAVDGYMDFYNHRRKHGSLKRMPPVTFSKWILQIRESSEFHRAM
ncbi:Integrase core domain protein [compost metagenome]